MDCDPAIAEERAALRHRPVYACRDGLCGADDCTTCFPMRRHPSATATFPLTTPITPSPKGTP